MEQRTADDATLGESTGHGRHRIVLDEQRSTHAFTHLAVVQALLVCLAVGAAVIWQLPGALVLAAPSMVAIAAAAFDSRPGAPGVHMTVDRPRALEGDLIRLEVTLYSPTPLTMVDVELLSDVEVDNVGAVRHLVSLPARTPVTVPFEVEVHTWGVTQLGHVTVRARDRFGLVAVQTWYQLATEIRVHIHEERASRLIEPDRFRRLVGSHLSGERSEGCEIADVRPYQPGDRLQTLNWRISARHDEPWITLRHPDRSTTILLLIDAHQRLGDRSADALRRSVRASLGLARLHLDVQDPVAMMIVGEGMRWIPPDSGRLHLHRMTDALLDLSSPTWNRGLLPPALAERRVPADAVVLAVSPLVDERFVRLLYGLKGRGHPVHVIEPLTDWRRNAHAVRSGKRFVPNEAARLFALRQQQRRTQLTHHGITVTPWAEDRPLDVALAGLRAAQRAQRVGAGR